MSSQEVGSETAQREEEEAALIIISLFLDNNPIKHPDIMRLDREDTQPSGDQTPSWLGSWGPSRLPLAAGGRVASCFATVLENMQRQAWGPRRGYCGLRTYFCFQWRKERGRQVRVLISKKGSTH